MAQNKLAMRQIHELLRLKYQNQLSIREMARSCVLRSESLLRQVLAQTEFSRPLLQYGEHPAT